MRQILFLAVLLPLAGSVALADGDAIVDIDGNSIDLSGKFARGGDGRLYALASSRPSISDSNIQGHLLAFDANGRPVSTFGTAGKITGVGGAVAVRPDGSVILGSGTISTFNANGIQIATYNTCLPGLCIFPGYVRSFLALADGRVYGGGGQRATSGSIGWTLHRIGADGMPDTTFGNEKGWTTKDGGLTREIVNLRALSNGQFVAMGWSGSQLTIGQTALSRFNPDGTTDFSFGTNGIVALGVTSPFPAISVSGEWNGIPLGVDQAHKLLVPGGTNIVARQNSDGTSDNTYVAVAVDGQTTYKTFAVDSLDRVVVFGERNGQAYVARLLPGGGLDSSFGTAGEVTFMPGAPDTSELHLTDGLVDDTNRPILYFHVTGASGYEDIGLARLSTGGVIDATFGAGVPDADVYPDPIAFASNTAPFGTSGVVSAPVTITGINAPTNVNLTNLSIPSTKGVSVGCTGTYTLLEKVLVNPGQTICVRHDAPSTAGASVTTTLNVGGRQVSYTTTSSAIASDITPDAFNFVDQTGVTPGTQVTSAPVTVTGITGVTPIAVDFGEYSLGCNPNGFRSSPGTIAGGQTVCVRVLASANFSTPVSTTLAINGVTDTFTATTMAADTTPGTFTYPTVINVGQGQSVSSVPITITDINTAAPVSVTGGRYAVNCDGAWTSQPGNITAGQFLCVENTSASAPGTSVTTTVTVGGYSTTFTSTTAGTSGGGNSSGGGGGAMSPRDLMMLGFALLMLRVWPAANRRRIVTSVPAARAD